MTSDSPTAVSPGTSDRPVPYQRPLARAARMVLAVQAAALGVVGVAGLVVSRGTGFLAEPADDMLGLRLNLAHSALLLLTGIVGGQVLFGSPAALRRFAAVQAIVYALLFAFGTAFSVARVGSTVLDLNVGDHVLHLVLALVGFSSVYVFAAHILEPSPADPSTDRYDGEDAPRG